MAEKKVPQRKCTGCRESFDKSALIRIVRTPEGVLAVDRSGRMNGRGAYVCDNPDCMEKALGRQSLARSFREPVSAEALEKLKGELGFR